MTPHSLAFLQALSPTGPRPLRAATHGTTTPHGPSSLTSITSAHPYLFKTKPRKPAKGREITQSAFRPHVAAADRLFVWRTPFGDASDARLAAELPPELADTARLSIMGALAINTRNSYGAGLTRFTQFCDAWDIPEPSRMPASYALLCAFIGANRGSTPGGTLKQWMSGIRAFHLVHRAPWYGDDDWVHMARISANKEGPKSTRPARAPVSIEHLLCLRAGLNIETPQHAAVWAVALVTFFGCRRLGETLITGASSFDSKVHVTRGTLYVLFLPPLWPLTLHLLTLPSESPFVRTETGRAQRASTSPGLKPPARRARPSLSPLAPTNFAQSRHSKTTCA